MPEGTNSSLSAPIVVTTMRIGRTDLGQARVVIDDDALVIVLVSQTDGRSIRVPLMSLDALPSPEDEAELTMLLRDGTRVTFITSSASQMRDTILLRCRALPELTRALRAFGSRRGHRGSRENASSEQDRFFAPLLDARRGASQQSTHSVSVMDAFDAASLTRSFEAALRTFAAERYVENGPARRALEAELTDLAEPLWLAMHALGDAATNARQSPDDLRLWRLWSAQLRATFEVADRVWLSLDAALDAAPWPT